MFGLASIVGLVAGGGAIAFDWLTQLVTWIALHRGAGYAPPGPAGDMAVFGTGSATGAPVLWALLLVPAIGGWLSAAVTTRFAPEAAGHGTDAAIRAYHSASGSIRGRVPFFKAIATALSLGTGGSAGREGPIAQIGAGFGSFLGNKLGLDARQRRILLAAGMGAGVGSIFRAPLAGALFTAEVLYLEAEFESDVVIPSFLSCTTAYCAYSVWAGDFGPLFHSDRGTFVFDDVSELVPYTILALLLVPMVYLFIKSFYGIETLCRRLKTPAVWTAAAGGLLTGACAAALWTILDDGRALSLMSHGYGVLQNALDLQVIGTRGALLLLLVALLKIATTALTISTGGSGGVFGPSMVIGGGVGGAVGILGLELGWVENPASFVAVGMCGFFAGAANTPISTIIMVSEMTGSYGLLLPAMWVCALTFLLCSRWTIYREQVGSRAESEAHRGEYLVPLLEKMTVADVFEPDRPLATIEQRTPLSEIFHIISQSTQDYFPVLDDEGSLVGVLSAYDIRAYTYRSEVHGLVIADDLVDPDPIVITPELDLHTALDKFRVKDLDVLPVVASDDSHRLLGMLPRRNIARAYQKKLQEFKATRRADTGDDASGR